MRVLFVPTPDAQRMSKAENRFRGIPIVESGSKYRTEAGFTAIKNGIKHRRDAAETPTGGKPPWLRAKMPSGAGFSGVRNTVREHRLSTVCEESMCPNIGECWNAGTATIMVMGSVCTRACRFCAVDTGNPRGWLDPDEPENTARAVELMNLNYVVITSVDRDDLDDGGAGHYAACVRAIKRRTPQTTVEALTPDFDGVRSDIETVLDSGLEVFAQDHVSCLLQQVAELRPRLRVSDLLDGLGHGGSSRWRAHDAMPKRSM